MIKLISKTRSKFKLIFVKIKKIFFEKVDQIKNINE